jgi:ubiquinone/menaquinone biosynthesis C-methylase UbiE
MKKNSKILKEKFYGKGWTHPYRTYEQVILDHIGPGSVVLDAGCGKNAPVLQKLVGYGKYLIGIDVCGLHKVEGYDSLDLLKSDLQTISLKNNSVDVVISRSVLEHVENPEKAYREIHRILKSGGHLICLTPNYYDYASLIAKLIPNQFHSRIVRLTEGRNENDTFPTYYRSNTERDIKKLAKTTGFEVKQIDYLGQYPSYFMFSPMLFILGTVYDKMICAFDSLRCLRGWILVKLKKRKDAFRL